MIAEVIISAEILRHEEGVHGRGRYIAVLLVFIDTLFLVLNILN